MTDFGNPPLSGKKILLTDFHPRIYTQADLDAALDEAIEAALLENNKNNEDWFGVAEGLWIWIINQPGGMNAPMQEGAADAVLENFKEAISAMLREARVEALRKALLMAEGAIVGGQDAYDTYRMIRDLIGKEAGP